MNEKTAVYNPRYYDLMKTDDLVLRFISHDSSERFNDFNPIIILGGTLADMFIGDEFEKTAEVVRREREIFNALEQGSMVCATFYIDPLVRRVLRRIDISYKTWEDPRVDFVIKRSEFSSFLKNHGSAKYSFSGDFDDRICEIGDNVVGFAKKVTGGVFVFLPCYILFKKFGDVSFLKAFLMSILDALRKYGPKIQYAPPTWIGSYRFHNEVDTLSDQEKLQKELDEKMNSLKRYLRLKEILWFRNNELVISAMNFFNEIGMKTKRDEIYEEDFWITENEKETVIVEVKGLDKNVKRPHISQLDEHRGAREKPDDFPALLIVNSFNKAKSLKEKDKKISTNEIKKAVRTNVLILRTLDLCNAYSLMEKKKLDHVTLLKVIREEVGWLRITASGLEIVK